MYSWAIILFCLLSVSPLICHSKADAAGNQILEYLNMHPDHVLEHEIVEIDFPDRLHKRYLGYRTPMNLRAFGLDINLLLHPTDSIFATDETPVYHAHYTPGWGIGVYYERIVGAMKEVGQLLEDPRHFASVTLGWDKFGKRTVNGFLRTQRDNEPLVVRSLPQHIVDGYLRNRRSINDSANSTYHFVAKLSENHSKDKSINQIYEAMAQRTWNWQNRDYPARPNTNNQRKPDILYPQVLVQLDFTYWNDLSTRGMGPFLEYVLAFWNSVDMVYRTINYPKIRLNIAGIVIATHPDATPYIANYMIKNDCFESYKALDALAEFFYTMRNAVPFDNCDFIALMTHHWMGTVELPYTVAGLAYVNKICEIDLEKKMKYGALLVQDVGAGNGIVEAAHELGHLLGFHHDREVENYNCPMGYVMGADPPAHNANWLSICSLNAVKEKYESGKYECLYDKPSTRGKELPKLVSGMIDDLDKQCEALGHGRAYFPANGSVDICVQFACYTPDGLQPPFPTPKGAAPGTPCGTANDVERKVCLKNRCVSV